MAAPVPRKMLESAPLKRLEGGSRGDRGKGEVGKKRESGPGQAFRLVRCGIWVGKCGRRGLGTDPPTPSFLMIFIAQSRVPLYSTVEPPPDFIMRRRRTVSKG